MIDSAITRVLEGVVFYRVLVRALNEARKEHGLVVSDRIRLVLAPDPALADAVTAHRDWIAGEVLAETFDVVTDPPAGAQPVSLGDATVHVALTKA